MYSLLQCFFHPLGIGFCHLLQWFIASLGNWFLPSSFVSCQGFPGGRFEWPDGGSHAAQFQVCAVRIRPFRCSLAPLLTCLATLDSHFVIGVKLRQKIFTQKELIEAKYRTSCYLSTHVCPDASHVCLQLNVSTFWSIMQSALSEDWGMWPPKSKPRRQLTM